MTDPTPKAARPRNVGRSKTMTARKPRNNFFRTQYYFTKGHEHLGKARDVLQEQSPFIYPPCSLMFSYSQYWRAKKRTTDKEKRMGVLKATGSHSLLRSLRVDVDIEALEAKKHKKLDEAMAITDVDPQFFSQLDSRMVKEKFCVLDYVEDNRQIFKARLLAGQQTDDCIRIDQQFVEEQRRLDDIKRRYRQYVSGFEEFLSKDHEESMNVLNKADDEVKLTREVTETRNQLSKEFGKVRLDVYHWEESWRMVKMCQRFLYQVSPIAWREKHDWIHRSESGESIIHGNADDLFGRYRMLDEVASLDTLIDLFEQDILDAGPTELYFKDPQDLILVFRALETQNLSALIHLESLAEPLADMLTTIRTAEEQIKLEVGEITGAINELTDDIQKLETRAADLEEYANELLDTAFREAVCSESVLRLQVFVEDAYESCVGPNEANLDSFSMMKWIEKTHEDLNLQLDTLPPEVVQFCEKEGFRQELRATKETEEAAKKFELMHRLLASLKRVMEPPVTKRRPLMWRSTPRFQRAKAKPPPPEPTEEEANYLTFFTNYCKQEDFIAYRSLFPDDFDLTFQETTRTETSTTKSLTDDGEDRASTADADDTES
ncbi:cilia- and flagella-associated protein 100-like [Ceratina calcarata]|uniref:Cilia- and flagella-associated protein 100-like n=1 Tax=Ceratina calcarata TaxID=156304 RepID=A0AAJ7J539_9HYME|nr:cilia- and flagella-associated protein 100-like [Ceratina calcarata]